MNLKLIINSIILILTFNLSFGQRNVANGKLTSQSSTGADGLAKYAVDGNTNGSYGVKSTTHTNQENAPWWEVDLGENYEITKIEIYNRIDDCCKDRIDGVEVYLKENKNDRGNLLETINYEEEKDVYVIEGIFSGRYVRLKKTNGGYLSLSEVRVLDDKNTIIDQISTALNNLKGTQEQVELNGKKHSALGYGVSASAGSHVQGMAVRENHYYFTYSDFPSDASGNILSLYGEPSKNNNVEREDIKFDGSAPYNIEGKGHPAGMQIDGNIMIVTGLNEYVAFYNCGGEKLKYLGKVKVTSNKASGGIAQDTGNKYYVITSNKLYHMSIPPEGDIEILRETKLSVELMGTNGGYALFNDLGDELACLILSDNYKVFLYSVHKNTGDVTLKKSITLDGRIWTFETPSFRQGGTARIEDGKLEIYVAPRRLDWGLQGSSDVYKWSAGLDPGGLCGCPEKTFRSVSDHSWVEFRLPAGTSNQQIFIESGAHNHYVFPKCNRVYWNDLKFRCNPISCKWEKTSGEWDADAFCHGSKGGSPYVFTGNK